MQRITARITMSQLWGNDTALFDNGGILLAKYHIHAGILKSV